MRATCTGFGVWSEKIREAFGVIGGTKNVHGVIGMTERLEAFQTGLTIVQRRRRNVQLNVGFLYELGFAPRPCTGAIFVLNLGVRDLDVTVGGTQSKPQILPADSVTEICRAGSLFYSGAATGTTGTRHGE